jgi:hypothetical protein
VLVTIPASYLIHSSNCVVLVALVLIFFKIFHREIIFLYQRSPVWGWLIVPFNLNLHSNKDKNRISLTAFMVYLIMPVAQTI